MHRGQVYTPRKQCLWEAWTLKATEYPPGVTLALSPWGGVSGAENKFPKVLRD